MIEPILKPLSDDALADTYMDRSFTNLDDALIECSGLKGAKSFHQDCGGVVYTDRPSQRINRGKYTPGDKKYRLYSGHRLMFSANPVDRYGEKTWYKKNWQNCKTFGGIE